MVEIAVSGSPHAAEQGHDFIAYIKWNSSSFDRMIHAVETFATSPQLISPIREMLLGQRVCDGINESNMPLLYKK